MCKFQIPFQIVRLDPRRYTLGENDYWIVHDACKSECPTQCQKYWKIQDRNNSSLVAAGETAVNCKGIL